MAQVAPSHRLHLKQICWSWVLFLLVEFSNKFKRNIGVNYSPSVFRYFPIVIVALSQVTLQSQCGLKTEDRTLFLNVATSFFSCFYPSVTEEHWWLRTSPPTPCLYWNKSPLSYAVDVLCMGNGSVFLEINQKKRISPSLKFRFYLSGSLYRFLMRNNVYLSLIEHSVYKAKWKENMFSVFPFWKWEEEGLFCQNGRSMHFFLIQMAGLSKWFYFFGWWDR